MKLSRKRFFHCGNGSGGVRAQGWSHEVRYAANKRLTLRSRLSAVKWCVFFSDEIGFIKSIDWILLTMWFSFGSLKRDKYEADTLAHRALTFHVLSNENHRFHSVGRNAYKNDANSIKWIHQFQAKPCINKQWFSMWKIRAWNKCLFLVFAKCIFKSSCS